jgi:hypothetical protein
MKGAVACIMVMLVAYAFAGIGLTDLSDNQQVELNALEKWLQFRDDVDATKAISSDIDVGSRGKISSLEGPYPNILDDGSPNSRSPGDSPLWGEYCVSAVICQHIFSGSNLELTDGGGDFLAGFGHEVYLGDQDGNGKLEYVVFYFYIPWMSDGLDNDGDGCVDEPGGGSCGPIPDAMVVYETGIMPRIGGIDGTLLMNIEAFSSEDGGIEVYRTFVSPPFHAYNVRGVMMYPDVAGEFISYYAREALNGVNANPEMDNDQDDWYLGSIDARRFPDKPPINSACSAGQRSVLDSTFLRDDGWVVTSYNLVESYDSHDWNGDGDTKDHVSAYYAINPNNGNCRIGVNGALQGRHPRNSGYVLIPSYTTEIEDGRDWNGDGDTFDTVVVYHDINTTWTLKGKIYRSYTYNSLLISRQKFGFGWWGILTNDNSYDTLPLKTGGAFERYVGVSQGYYKTYFSNIGDEDGDHGTALPAYEIGYGQPSSIHGGECIQISAREHYLEYAGVQLIGGMADGNGDGDTHDILNYIFCPDASGGGGDFIIEATSKYAWGLYRNLGFPFIWEGYFTIHGSFEINGRVTIPINMYEIAINEDCNLDMKIDYNLCSSYYQYDI